MVSLGVKGRYTSVGVTYLHNASFFAGSFSDSRYTKSLGQIKGEMRGIIAFYKT